MTEEHENSFTQSAIIARGSWGGPLTLRLKAVTVPVMLKAMLLAATLACSGAALAQYKWVDKNGRVQYGDTPPTGADVTKLRPTAPPATPPEPQARNESGPAEVNMAGMAERWRTPPEIEREQQAQAERDARTRRENCSRAQEYTRGLETGRVARFDAKGERAYLDEAQLAEEKAKARQAIKEWCG
jgi:Domain of unknown function (DUF4124)